MTYFRSDHIHHPDEVIPISVYQYMVEHKTLDNNWTNADLRPEFKYDQYNFSSYIYISSIFAHTLESTLDLMGLSINTTVIIFRLFSAILGVLCVYVTFLVGIKLLGVIGWIPALFVAVNPLMVQDSHYARPESFLTLLSLLILLTSIEGSQRKNINLIYLSAVLCGYAVASKFSLLPVCLFPLIAFVKGKFEYKLSPVVVLTFILGLAVGVPYLFLNFSGYLNGVNYLLNQYSNYHPPHGPFKTSMALHIAAYYIDTLGWVLVILSLISIFYISKVEMENSKVWLYAIWLLFLIHVIYFSSKIVFVERNLSHLIPFLMVISAIPISIHLTELWQRIVAIILALFKPAIVVYLLLLSFSGLALEKREKLEGQLVRKYNSEIIISTSLLSAAQWQGLVDDVKSLPMKKNHLVRIIDYNDEFSSMYAQNLSDISELEKVGEYNSVFHRLSTSTLYVYQDPNCTYFLISK